MEPNFSDYEKKVIREIARHMVEPNAIQKALKIAGKPVEKVMDAASRSNIKVIRKITGVVQQEIQKGILRSIRVTRRSHKIDVIIQKYHRYGVPVRDINEIQRLPLHEMDFVSDRFNLSNAALMGLEGVILGMATTLAEAAPLAFMAIPTLVATDVSMSVMILSRHVSQVATCYGYPSSADETIPHILAAMAPYQDSSDEGYLSSKAMVIGLIRDAGQFVVRYSGRTINRQIIEREAPQLVKLINYLAERLGRVITQKELGMIVPISGAVLNGGVNVAFQQVGHTTAKDYFRRLLLEKKYGAEDVHAAIQAEVEALRN